MVERRPTSPSEVVKRRRFFMEHPQAEKEMMRDPIIQMRAQKFGNITQEDIKIALKERLAKDRSRIISAKKGFHGNVKKPTGFITGEDGEEHVLIIPKSHGTITPSKVIQARVNLHKGNSIRETVTQDPLLSFIGVRRSIDRKLTDDKLANLNSALWGM